MAACVRGRAWRYIWASEEVHLSLRLDNALCVWRLLLSLFSLVCFSHPPLLLHSPCHLHPHRYPHPRPHPPSSSPPRLVLLLLLSPPCFRLPHPPPLSLHRRLRVSFSYSRVFYGSSNCALRMHRLHRHHHQIMEHRLCRIPKQVQTHMKTRATQNKQPGSPPFTIAHLCSCAFALAGVICHTGDSPEDPPFQPPFSPLFHLFSTVHKKGEAERGKYLQ